MTLDLAAPASAPAAPASAGHWRDPLARRAAPASAFAGHWRDPAARRADAAVHLAGAAAALTTAAPALFAASEGVLGPLALYALALAALFPASALFQHGPAAWRDVTIKIDHAAIYLTFAATCGALAAVAEAPSGTAAAPWALAAAGAGLRALGPPRMRAASLAIHLVVALGGLAAIRPALAALSPEAWRLVLLGGGAYLAGLLVHLREDLRFGQAIWHALALIASGLVCAAILVELG